ncbi:MAG: exodeoxyribonuclease VII small subunit [Lachnospiraceae bacterium]|nr:exodeoxyribonuclease VII small subunit [Lachnospiraceae bacterium]
MSEIEITELDGTEESKKDDIVIEEVMERLDEICAKLENEKTSLKEAMTLYTEGVKLAALARENLEGVEKEIKILNEI